MATGESPCRMNNHFDMDEEPSCLFVANLPQRMTNEELAVALLTIFKPFGVIVSVKASRDPKGRPFGFVEFQGSTSATQALSYGPNMALDNRRIRVEPARRQRKLCIKHRLGPDDSLDCALSVMRADLKKFVGDQDFKLSLQSGGEADQETLSQGGGSRAGSGIASPTPSSGNSKADQVVAAIIKFEDAMVARQACENWARNHPEWTMTWINLDRTAFGSNIRNSGLVQLVPSADGSIFIPPATPTVASILQPGLSPFFGSSHQNHVSPPLFGALSSLTPPPPPAPQSSTVPNAPATAVTPFFDWIPGTWSGIPFPSPRYTPVYEEQFFEQEKKKRVNGEEESSSLVRKLEQMSLVVPDVSMDWLSEWLGRTLFVGRLNGQLVTLSQLAHHFSLHGMLSFIRLYNRGVVGFDGVPLDAYAFIRYEEMDSVSRAINEEHGRVWLGQAMKCEHARPESLAAIFGATQSSTMVIPTCAPAIREDFECTNNANHNSNNSNNSTSVPGHDNWYRAVNDSAASRTRRQKATSF